LKYNEEPNNRANKKDMGESKNHPQKNFTLTHMEKPDRLDCKGPRLVGDREPEVKEP